MALRLIDNIISQIDQWELNSLLKYLHKGIGCLDTRHLSTFYQHRLLNATHIFEKELADRLFELPSKNIPFILIAHSDKSSNILQQNGYQNFIEFKLNPFQWQLLTNHHKQLMISANKTNHKIQYIPLFHPCPLLQSHINEIEHNLYKKYNGNNNKIITLKCCDIGCGSGRDDIWLALRNNNRNLQWNVDCIDYNYKMLERVTKLALHANVSDKICIIKSKIGTDYKISMFKDMYDDKPFLIHHLKSKEKNVICRYNASEAKLCYYSKEYDLIICCRFLERCIVNKLWKIGKMLKQNGYLLMFTFMQGSQKFGPKRPRNPNYLLKKGELGQIFNDRKMFRIVVDQQLTLDDGRPMQAFLCQKLTV